MAKPVKPATQTLTVTSVGQNSNFSNEAGVFGNANAGVVTEAFGDSETYNFSNADASGQYLALTNDPEPADSRVIYYRDTNDNGLYDAGTDLAVTGPVDPSSITLNELAALSGGDDLIARFDDSNAPDEPDGDFDDIVLLLEMGEGPSKVHANSGRGNGSELDEYGNDIDPGNSGGHNNGGDGPIYV